MSFFDRYGLGMQQGGGFNPQAQDPRMQTAAPRMIAPSPSAQGSGVGSYNDLERALANSGIAPSVTAATIPINPGASGGGAAPISTGSPAVINGATGAVEPPAIAPTSIPMPEGVTRRDRLMAGFSMMAAAGTADFSRVAAGVNVGLIEKEKNAREARQEMMALTQPQSYQVKINDQIFLATEPAKARYNKETNSIEMIPVEEQGQPTYKPLLDARDATAEGADHPGGASGWREEDYVKNYQELPKDQQLAFAEAMGVDDRALTEFELKTIWNKNSAGLAGAIASATKGANINTEAETKDFIQLRDNVEYIEDDLRQIDEQIKRVKDNPNRGGIFQPIEQLANAVRAEFGSKDGALKATNEQIMGSMAIQNMMAWFKEQGLGARGLDTPAEFRAWLRATGGDLTMTNETALYFLEKRRNEMLRNVDRYNRSLTDPKYKNVDRIDEYQPLPDYRSRYETDDAAPEPPPGFVIQGTP